MAIKVHTCPNTWVHGGHPCWKVLKAVQDSGMPFEQVKEPLRRSRRTAVQEHTGQRKLPAIELEDGTWIREESSELVRRIQAGELSPAAGS
jgi:glutathione S-transferase